MIQEEQKCGKVESAEVDLVGDPEKLEQFEVTAPKKNRKLKCDCQLISMCLITVVSNCAYALIAPFLPIELVK